MTTQELIEKAKREALSEEEVVKVMEGINSELQSLKEVEPQKYLELLQELNGIIRDLNTDLKHI